MITLGMVVFFTVIFHQQVYQFHAVLTGETLKSGGFCLYKEHLRKSRAILAVIQQHI